MCVCVCVCARGGSHTFTKGINPKVNVIANSLTMMSPLATMSRGLSTSQQ